LSEFPARSFFDSAALNSPPDDHCLSPSWHL